MGFSKLTSPTAALILLLALLSVLPARAQYAVLRGDEPRIRAILYFKENPRALIYYNDQRFHAIPHTRLDDEWYVEEIRRESILFKRTTSHSFAELYLNAPQKAKFHKDWSFYGHPIALWEAVELLAHGFGYQAVMHFQAGGAVVPGSHGDTLGKLLKKILPPHHRFAFEGPVLMVLPVQPSGEEWTEVLERMKLCVPERLSLRYPGLNKPGVILSRGDDIQFILRKIALGGKVPIQFPRDLHFPVYASFRNVPFAQMLVKILYLNQCILIEREEGLEVTPWPRQILQRRPYADFPLIKAMPSEPQQGTGPSAPPQLSEHLLNHPVVQQNRGSYGNDSN
ncbi:MAG TPA: hypothetical protein PLM07_00805 [Candidatus Rifleibacterium sp.]|nr:hypothetical protein [Candidatus Rifleibacterium sp.]HPT44420.1 hypothetical protein [Candidatus Rifleibacterium sp.]